MLEICHSVLAFWFYTLCVKACVGLPGACIFIWSSNNTSEFAYHPPILKEIKTMASYAITGLQSMASLSCLCFTLSGSCRTGPASYSLLETQPPCLPKAFWGPSPTSQSHSLYALCSLYLAHRPYSWICPLASQICLPTPNASPLPVTWYSPLYPMPNAMLGT